MRRCIYIDYLDTEICLEPEEYRVWEEYIREEIPYSEFIRRATDILREKGVPRGRLRSTAMYILGKLESGEYREEEEIEEFVRTAVVEFDWTGRTEYCRRSGHDIVTECYVSGMFTCPEECFNEKQNTIRDRLAEHLWDAYRKFLESEYIYIRESDTTEGFSRFEVADVIETEEVEIRFEIYSVAFYRGNSCGGELRHMGYYDRALEGYIHDSLVEFVRWLRDECGGHEA
jgi:hypothetical protein